MIRVCKTSSFSLLESLSFSNHTSFLTSHPAWKVTRALLGQTYFMPFALVTMSIMARFSVICSFYMTQLDEKFRYELLESSSQVNHLDKVVLDIDEEQVEGEQRSEMRRRMDISINDSGSKADEVVNLEGLSAKARIRLKKRKREEKREEREGDKISGGDDREEVVEAKATKSTKKTKKGGALDDIFSSLF